MYALQFNKKMFESDSTTIQTNNSELCYYEQLQNHINSLSKKFREKCVIKQNVYMCVDRQLVVLVIVKASVIQNNVHAKKWECIVQQNVIQNVAVVPIWVNRLKFLDL